MNYFIFNKAMDYRRGMNWNTEFDDTGIWVRSSEAGEPGVFVSRILDAGEKETPWHRICFDFSIGDNMAVYVNLYGADTSGRAESCMAVFKEELDRGMERVCGAEGEETSHRYLESACFLAESKMADCLRMELKNPEDLLLWDIKARYLWIAVMLWGTAEGSPKLKQLTAYFPKQTWLSYLPEVYQTGENSFLERFLAVFQILYEEQEQKIRGNSRELDIASSDEETLMRLAGWLDMDHVRLWPPKHLRRYLAGGADSFRRRGTGRGLVEMVAAYTGERVFLREEASPTPSARRNASEEDSGLLRLYVPERAVSSQAAYRALLTVVKEGKPTDTEVKIVVLRPELRLDSNTCLGINSRVSSYKKAALNGVSRLGTVIAGGKM